MTESYSNLMNKLKKILTRQFILNCLKRHDIGFYIFFSENFICSIYNNATDTLAIFWKVNIKKNYAVTIDYREENFYNYGYFYFELRN